MTHFQGIIFDVDGTLVDSNDVHAKAWTEALHANGYPVEYQHIRRLIGMGGDNLLPEVANLDNDSALGKRISNERGERFRSAYLPHLVALPGAKALVERLHADGFQLVVASSATAEELGPLLDVAGVKELLSEQTSSDDAKHSKPEPDIVEAALAKIGLAAEKAVMIGDTPYDIEAAQKAGVAVIAFRCGGWSDEELSGAIAIYDDPADLLSHYAESPLSQRNAVAA